MPSSFVPKPPGEAATDAHPQRADMLRRAVHRAQRVFLAVNAVPLAGGVVLSCAADLAALPVYGRLTLGIVWAVLQLGVFVAGVYWYEHHSTRVCDPLEERLVSGPPPIGAPDAAPADEWWR